MASIIPIGANNPLSQAQSALPSASSTTFNNPAFQNGADATEAAANDSMNFSVLAAQIQATQQMVDMVSHYVENTAQQANSLGKGQ